MKKLTLAGALLLYAAPVAAQAPPPPVVSPEVQADRRVTFRFRAPNAKEVILAREGAAPVADAEGRAGRVDAHHRPLAPDIYGYTFVADGMSLTDPNNPLAKPNLVWAVRAASTSRAPRRPGRSASVPRGTLNRHFYRSAIVGDERDFYVYTPPGYDPGAATTLSGALPAARLQRRRQRLDGGRPRARDPRQPDRAGQGEADAGGDAARLRRARDRRARASAASATPACASATSTSFRDALLAEVIPQVEKAYRVADDRDSRAIAGLSMGGAESLYIGLNALDRFAWIGAFSSAACATTSPADFPALDAKANDKFRLLWIACGTEDRLIDVEPQVRRPG